MITEDYVSYEVAKLLKEKGFNEYTNMVYKNEWVKAYEEGKTGTQTRVKNFYGQKESDSLFTLCPTHQMAMKWLREVHGLNIFVIQDEENQNCFRAIIQSKLLINGRYGLNRETYEGAVEAAIEYSLENLI